VSINVYKLGDLVRIAGVFKDINGTLIDPGTVALTVSKRSGRANYTYPATVIKDSAGNYHVDVSATERGTWLYEWITTGTGQATEHGEFVVEAR
jgi:uncharacterized protein YfaS (alpha-2-macroglobulin family)